MTTVVITDCDFGDGSVEAEVLGGGFRLAQVEAHTEDDVISAASEADGLLVQWAPISKRVLAALPGLQAIVRYGVGLDNVDVEAAARHGVQVSNVPDYCIDEVAEHTVSLICAAARRLSPLDRLTGEGEWAPNLVPKPLRFADDPVGVAGLGRIGQAVVRRLLGLGFPVMVYDPLVGPTTFPELRRASSLEELGSWVNHLTLHMPATPDTTGMCDGQVIKALGPRGHLVNTSRGALVDEDALLAALNSGQLWRASLDVLLHEPPTGSSAELTRHPSVLATPHIGYLSTESAHNLRQRAAARLKELLAVTSGGA